MLPCYTRRCRGVLCLASIMLPLSAEEPCHRGDLDGKFTVETIRNRNGSSGSLPLIIPWELPTEPNRLLQAFILDLLLFLLTPSYILSYSISSSTQEQRITLLPLTSLILFFSPLQYVNTPHPSLLFIPSTRWISATCHTLLLKIYVFALSASCHNNWDLVVYWLARGFLFENQLLLTAFG